MNTTTTSASVPATDERPIVWHACVSKTQHEGNSSCYPEVPYFTDEARAKRWCERVVREEMTTHGHRALRWRLQGIVEAGRPTTGPLGRDAFEPMEEGYYQYYGLVGEQWIWTGLGFRPD